MVTVIWLKKAYAAAASALLKFCQTRKCAVSIQLEGEAISVEASTVEDMERLLRTVDSLFIHPVSPGATATRDSAHE